MRVILGVTDGDDAGAALLVDGKLIAAVNEERLNRMKMSIGFPKLAIKEVMRLGNVKAEDIDHVAMAAYTEVHILESKPYTGWFGKASLLSTIRNSVGSALSKPLSRFPIAFTIFRWIKKATLGRRQKGVRNVLNEMGIHAPITYHTHHLCHALSAYEASGFDEAISISLDGGGDASCSHVWVFEDGKNEQLNRVDSFHSIGNYYAYVTHLCGYRAAIHEGKITGLSARGEPLYLDMFRSLITYKDGQIENIGRVYRDSAIKKMKELLPQDWKHEDLAASIQQHLEDVALKYISFWIKKSGKNKVCLSGGVFANVLLNQKIVQLPECEEVFVFPAMGDGGLASGSAYDAWRKFKDKKPSRKDSFLPHVYLGPSFTDDEIEAEIKKENIDHKRYDDIEKVAAHLIHEGRVVARFNGGMEYGPRALGNRTLMFHTGDPSVNDWLNKRLNRTEFMPFAPACLSGYEEKLFKWEKGAARASRFMTITMACTEWMKEHCPAVVHIDGTARPQIVDKETNPSFYKIIEYYNELSGIPVVVNTSFNMHEEPIVCTPYDAIRAYKLGRLDNLAIGSFLLGEPPSNM